MVSHEQLGRAAGVAEEPWIQHGIARRSGIAWRATAMAIWQPLPSRVGVPSHGGDYLIRVEGRYGLRQLVRPLPHPRPPVLTSWRQNFGAAYRVTIAVGGNLARMLRGQFVQSSDTPDTFRQAPGEQARGRELVGGAPTRTSGMLSGSSSTDSSGSRRSYKSLRLDRPVLTRDQRGPKSSAGATSTCRRRSTRTPIARKQWSPSQQTGRSSASGAMPSHPRGQPGTVTTRVPSPLESAGWRLVDPAA